MEFILMIICILMYWVVLREERQFNNDETTTETIVNNEDVNDINEVVSVIQANIIWVLHSDLEDKRERLVYLLRTMIDYTDTSDFLDRNPSVFKYIFENT